MNQPFNHVAIVGVGLIGGSIAKTLRVRKLADRITGFGRNRNRMRLACEMGIVDAGYDCYDALADADLVIVGTPVCAIDDTIERLAPCLRPGTVVTDVGSVKLAIVEQATSRMPTGVTFVGAHPIAGTENSGFEHAIDSLFVDRLCITTPIGTTDPTALDQVEAFWRALGARVARMDAGMHDRLFGAVSHLPHMVAFSLVNAIVGMRGFNNDLLGFSAGGFRDFTRIAASDPVMWRDIALMNRDNVIEAMTAVEDKLAELKQAIVDGDADAIETFFRASRDARRAI